MRFMSDVEEFVVRILERYWYLWPPRAKAIARASWYKMEGKRKYKFIECERCGKRDLKEAEIEVHHLIHKIPLTGFDNIADFAHRLLCKEDGLLVLCKPCHKEIHAGDKRIRIENKGKK